jgi:hypothetical protein
LIASSEGEAAAADYLAAASTAMRQAGYEDGAGVLASQGLRYAGDRRDATWASLATMDIMREEVQDPNYPGIQSDTPRWREVHKALENLPPEQHPTAFLVRRVFAVSVQRRTAGLGEPFAHELDCFGRRVFPGATALGGLGRSRRTRGSNCDRVAVVGAGGALPYSARQL